MKQIVTVREYFQDRYGQTLYRVPIDPGLPCPHRDKEGRGGCLFCSENGGRARHLTDGLTLKEQVEKGIRHIRMRYHAEGPYAAYFQAFTPTNAEIHVLRKIYETVLSCADFKAVFIATRPDALPDDVLDYIEELNSRYEVWVELGVQTASEATLKLINRGHDFSAVQNAVKRLHERGIKTAAHVILGLPGESEEDYENTAKALSALPFDGIKVHHLQILRRTGMERLFDQGKVHPMNEYEYADALSHFLHLLPEHWIVMRLCADASPSELLAPRWWMDKGTFTEKFLRMFNHGETLPQMFRMIRTDDGSYTIYHPRQKEYFHVKAGAWEESQRKYIQPCRIRELLESGENGSILDVGFGTGFNVCAAALLAESMKNHTKLYITTLEHDPAAISAALNMPEHPGRKILESIAGTGTYESENASISLMSGDARDSVKLLNAHFDYIFLDGFPPEKNPELWTLEFVEHLKDLLKASGYLASWCSDFPYLNALLKNQFHIYETKPFGRSRGGTIAVLDALPWLPPFSRKDLSITTETTAGTPYRDPLLRWSREQIKQQHAEKIAVLRQSGMPKWYKGISS